MRITTVVVAGLVAALALAGTAVAGGYATVQLGSLPSGTEAGGTWTAELTVLQHGRTPLEGIVPIVRLTGADGTRLEYEAAPTGVAGQYRADVVFPEAGTWTWEIWDGFTRTHTYAPVVIGAPADDGVPLGKIGLIVAALLGLALVAVLAARGLRPKEAPLPQ